jgi:hypothetical protein
MRMHVQIQEVLRGDKLIDNIGRPYFLVTDNLPAQAKDYRVLIGERLTPGEGHRQGGHRHNIVEVERQVASDRNGVEYSEQDIRDFCARNHRARSIQVFIQNGEMVADIGEFILRGTRAARGWGKRAPEGVINWIAGRASGGVRIVALLGADSAQGEELRFSPVVSK